MDSTTYNTAGFIIERLKNYFASNCKFIVTNTFIYNDRWETDVFMLKQSGYTYEIEVKISKADFKRDFKKTDKHIILEQGKIQKKEHVLMRDDNGKVIKDSNGRYKYDVVINLIDAGDKRPNKFYYCAPEGILSLEEIPSYAGFITINNSVLKIVKEAPLLHKGKYDYTKILCDRFYYYWQNAELQLKRMKSKIQ